MKIFGGFNEKGKECPICKTTKNAKCTLIPIYGTNNDSSIYEAKAIHVDCLDLLYYPDAFESGDDAIVQKVEEKKHA